MLNLAWFEYSRMQIHLPKVVGAKSRNSPHCSTRDRLILTHFLQIVSTGTMLMHTHTGNKENAGSCMRLHWTIPSRWFYARLMHNAIASRRVHCWCNFVLYTRTVASIDVWLHPTTACYVWFSFLVAWLYAAFCVWCTTLSPFILVLSSRAILLSA